MSETAPPTVPLPNPNSVPELEVIDYSTPGALDQILRIGRETWHGDEPGFHIDEVRTMGGLTLVLNALTEASGTTFDHFDGYVPGEIRPIQEFSPHTDKGMRGLAVHQEISGHSAVSLATSLLPEYKSDKETIDPALVKQIKAGGTFSGRLTVFSEGDGDNRMPTVHHFKRGEKGLGYWVRYSQVPENLRNSGYWEPSQGAQWVAETQQQVFTDPDLLPKHLPSDLPAENA